MSTRVVVTGTGTPIATPDRAGPGVLVSHGGTHVQFDAGRATVMRLAAIDINPTDLAAVFITHQHSDHVVGLADLLMTRWLDGSGPNRSPLAVFAPSGMAADLVQHLLVPWEKEMAMRQAHREYPSTPHPEVHDFEPPPSPAGLAEFGGMTVEVSQVRHEPVSDAVGYRIMTPDGVVAISGDTTVCAETEALASGADVLVHEAFFTEKLDPETVSDRDALAAYHSDPEPVGELARRAGVKTLMLTHLIPPPRTELDAGAFEAAVRRGGFEGNVIVCSDLDSVTF